MSIVAQVARGNVDPAGWLSQALTSLPALEHMPPQTAAQAVAVMLDTVLDSPALCSPLAGPFTKTANFISTLLTSQLPHVGLTAYKTLTGAATVGPPALRTRTDSLLCQKDLLSAVVMEGLAGKASQPFAAQLLQAIVVEGDHDEGRASLAPWSVWLTCYQQDHAIGGTITGIIDCLQAWR